MAVVDELVAILGYEVKGQDKLRAFTQSIDDAAKRIATFAAAAATAAAGAAALLGKSVLQTGMQFEKLNLQLEILEGSAQKAGERMEWLREFAVNTPLDLQQATDAFVRMRNFGLDPLDGSMQAIVDANALMGGSADRLNGIILALGQAWTKQKFQAEEANQLLERGIPAWELMSEATGMTTAKLMELSEKGKIGRKEIKLLIEQMGIRASGASARFAKTMEGQIGKLQDLFMTFKKRIADAGFYDAVKLQLNRLFDYISRLDADGTLQRWATALSASFTKASDFIADFAVRIGRHLGTIADIINNNRDAWDWLKWVLGAIALRLFPVTALFAAAALALDDFLTYMRGGQSVIGDFIQALADFMGAEPEQVANALKAIATAAGMLVGAAIGVSLFAGAVRSLAGALGLMGAAGAVAGVGNLGNAGKAAGGIRGPGFGIMSMLGLQSAISMGSGTLEEGKARGAAMNKWFEENIGTPRSWLGSVFTGNGGGATDGSVSARPGQTTPELAQMMRNLEGNAGRMGASTSGAAVQNNVNDSSDKSVNVTINQTVQQATDAPAAAASATANAAAGAASRSLPPPRFVPGGV